MRHKVADLEGALLDAAVAKAEGGKSGDWMRDVEAQELARCGLIVPPAPYSTNWQYGGPLIERERIDIQTWKQHNQYPVPATRAWLAYHRDARGKMIGEGGGCGPTPLIAAMRAFCASRFGGEIELP